MRVRDLIGDLIKQDLDAEVVTASEYGDIDASVPICAEAGPEDGLVVIRTRREDS